MTLPERPRYSAEVQPLVDKMNEWLDENTIARNNYSSAFALLTCRMDKLEQQIDTKLSIMEVALRRNENQIAQLNEFSRGKQPDNHELVDRINTLALHLESVDETIVTLVNRINEMINDLNISHLNQKNDVAAVNNNCFKSHLELASRIMQLEAEIKALKDSK